MSLNWSDLGAALALYLILEGILPFLHPQGLKRAMAAMAAMGDKQLRVFGLGSMLAGLVLLNLIH